jgi:hypothetical protein
MYQVHVHSNTLVCLYHPGVHTYMVHVVCCTYMCTCLACQKTCHVLRVYLHVVPVPRVPQLFNDTGAVRGACRLKISSHHAQPTIVAFLVIL